MKISLTIVDFIVLALALPGFVLAGMLFYSSKKIGSNKWLAGIILLISYCTVAMELLNSNIPVTLALDAKLHPYKSNPAVLQSFVGTYSGRLISLTKGQLYFTDTNGYHIGLIPVSKAVFIFTTNDRRLEFKRNGNRKIYGFDFIYPDGRAERFGK